MAPGAIWLMNACCAAVPGTCVASADGTFLVYDGPDGAGELGCAPAAGACSPGIAAVPAAWDAGEPCRAWEPCRACDPCRAWEPCRAGIPAGPGSPAVPGSLPGLGSAVRAGLGRGSPVARPGRGAAGPAGEVGHRARHRHHALRAEAPRPACCAHHPGRTFPRRRAMTLGRAASASLPRRRRGDRRERRSRHGRAARVRLPLAQEPGRLDLRRTACGRRGARGRTALLAHRAEQLAVVDEAGHALRGQRAGERVRVDREVRRESPPIVRRAPGE